MGRAGTLSALARLRKLETRRAGIYTIVCETTPEGEIISWWDAMRGCPTSEDDVEHLRLRYDVCIRAIPESYLGGA
jgi:hypothetical protein